MRIPLLNGNVIKLYGKLLFELKVSVRDEMYEKLFYFHQGFEFHIHRATFMLITECTYLCSPVFLSRITYSARNLQRSIEFIRAIWTSIPVSYH